MPLFTFSVPFVPVNQINQIKSQMYYHVQNSEGYYTYMYMYMYMYCRYSKEKNRSIK